MPETGAYVYLGGQQKFRVSLVDGAVVKRESHLACMDARCVAFPLTVRPVKTGDRFQPLGMEAGTRLVSDFLTDRHLSLFEKRRTLVLTDASGNIVWLVDQRPDHRFRVTDETRSTLIVEHIVGDESHA
jgi:tRNA(Ile)-lysidine synthase